MKMKRILAEKEDGLHQSDDRTGSVVTRANDSHVQRLAPWYLEILHTLEIKNEFGYISSSTQHRRIIQGRN